MAVRSHLTGLRPLAMAENLTTKRCTQYDWADGTAAPPASSLPLRLTAGRS